MKLLRWFSLLGLVGFVFADDSRPNHQNVIYLGENGVIVLRLEIQVGGKSPQEFFEQYVDDLMASIDGNNDGVVTLDESRGKYLSAGDAARAQLIPQTEVPSLEASPDVNPQDGVLTRQEFLTYFKRIGLHPFMMVYQQNPTSVSGNRPARQTANATETPLFARLDRNGDGKLTSEELTDALRTLRKLDLDDDETISAAELSPLAFANQVQPPQPTNSRTPISSPFLGVGSDESLSKQIRRLIEKYDSSDSAKSGIEGLKVRNQKLSPEELGLPIAEFERFDGDGDRQLDFDELRRFLVSADSTITIVINLDLAEPINAESKRETFQQKLRTSPDGSVNINLGTTQLSFVRGLIDDIGSAESIIKPQFQQADANGYLERSEAERAFLFGITFEELDTDKNGKLFLDEAVAYFKIRFDAARSRTVLSINEQGRTLFEILDTDRDRRLSQRELQAAAGKLALWDRDGDGLLSESEIPQQFQLTIARGTLPVLIGNLLSSGMNPTGELPERTSGPIWFRKMDKNRDGEISIREFLGDSILFEKLDRNHNGAIDVVEAVQSTVE